METKEIIIIGGSAGSINVILKILPVINAEVCLPVIIILHRKPSDENVLEKLLQLKCTLQVNEVEDKMPIEYNRIYLAPPNYHLLIEKDKTFTLDDSEKVNFSRPNIDVCMESLVQIYNNKVVGILLTGANNDGALGMKKIRDAGGFTIIQKPETCLFPVMPNEAQKLSEPNLQLSPEEIATFIMNIKI